MIALPSSQQQPSETLAVSDVKPVFDTSSVCSRNSIINFTFHDPGNFIRELEYPGSDKTVINLTRQAKIINERKNEILISHLKSGEAFPENQKNEDWLIVIIFAAALLLTLVRSSKNAFQNIENFFLFRGINEPGSHNPAGLFQWQTTIKNLAAFIITGLFVYKSISWFGFIPPGMHRITAWLVCLAAVVLAITLRHIICVITGILSGTTEIFNEYLTGVYLSYHFSAIILAALTIIISYTKILPPNILITAGIIAFGVMYLLRVIRLLIIFLNRNISILYLILYLCALEILPVAITIRYFMVI